MTSFSLLRLIYTYLANRARRMDMFGRRGPSKGVPPLASTVLSSLVSELDTLLVVPGSASRAGELGQASDGLGGYVMRVRRA